MLHSPDSDSLESSRWDAVFVVVSVESVMVVHRLMIDLTLSDRCRLFDAIQSDL
jgi:hypothetical protein